MRRASCGAISPDSTRRAMVSQCSASLWSSPGGVVMNAITLIDDAVFTPS